MRYTGVRQDMYRRVVENPTAMRKVLLEGRPSSQSQIIGYQPERQEWTVPSFIFGQHDLILADAVKDICCMRGRSIYTLLECA